MILLEDNYTCVEIKNIKEVYDIFAKEDCQSWLFVGTGGFHGTEQTLCEMEKTILTFHSERNSWYCTVLIIEPQQCSLKWGEVEVKLEDVDFLRRHITETHKILTELYKKNI